MTINTADNDKIPLPEVASRLGIDTAGIAQCVDWEKSFSESLADMQAYLSPSYIQDAVVGFGLSQEMVDDLVDFARRMGSDLPLVAFFRYCRYRVLRDPTMVQDWREPWPPLDSHLGIKAGLVNVLVMLSAVPEMRNRFRELGIPDVIAHDTLADLRRWMETDSYYQNHRQWGITPWIARWLCNHWQGKLLQLGRLQFSHAVFDGPLTVYRRRGSSDIVALANPGLRFNADGSAWGECCGDRAGSWESREECGPGFIAGNPVNPSGHAVRQMVSLPVAEWEPVLAPGSGVLHVHIPTGGSLNFEACGDSFRQALDIFPRLFPELDFRGFSTGTWLMDPRFSALLAPEANIVRLQGELYLYPGIQGNNDQIRNRVFGWGVTDISAVPWTTSLQKAVGRYLTEGGHFHGGYFFCLRDGFDWGKRVYRSQWPDSGVPGFLQRLIRYDP
jgi:hypothetical protein